MSVKSAVLSFGCPRSGTTFMQHCINRLSDVFVVKMQEHRRFHPCKDNNGLWDLAHLLIRHHVVWIRTVRHPMEVVESFEAVRFDERVAPKERGSLGKNTDERVVRWITEESENFHHQRADLTGVGKRHRLVEIRYEQLASPEYRQSVARAVTETLPNPERNYAAFLEGLNGFGVKPARVGRLSEGVGSVLTPERRAWFRERLAATIAREGYE